jgi:hypothetical protein
VLAKRLRITTEKFLAAKDELDKLKKRKKPSTDK